MIISDMFSSLIRGSVIVAVLFFAAVFLDHFILHMGTEYAFTLLGYVAVGFSLGSFCCQQTLIERAVSIILGDDDAED